MDKYGPSFRAPARHRKRRCHFDRHFCSLSSLIPPQLSAFLAPLSILPGLWHLFMFPLASRAPPGRRHSSTLVPFLRSPTPPLSYRPSSHRHHSSLPSMYVRMTTESGFKSNLNHTKRDRVECGSRMGGIEGGRRTGSNECTNARTCHRPLPAAIRAPSLGQWDYRD